MRITKDFMIQLGFQEIDNHRMALEYDSICDPEIDARTQLVVEGLDKDVCLVFSTEDHDGRWLMTFHNDTTRLINAIIIVMKGIGSASKTKYPTYYKSIEQLPPEAFSQE